VTSGYPSNTIMLVTTTNSKAVDHMVTEPGTSTELLVGSHGQSFTQTDPLTIRLLRMRSAR
jgi:hypothetical protein